MFIVNTLDEGHLRQPEIHCFGGANAPLAGVVGFSLSRGRLRILQNAIVSIGTIYSGVANVTQRAEL